MTLPPVQTAPIPTPRPFPAEPTPQPTATPIVLPPPTLRPTPTPQPIPTHLPTATPLLLPPPSTPQPTPTPDPTATPQPTATPIPTPTPVSLPATIQIVPQASGPAVSTLPGGLTLTIDPGKPLAGRDISFSLAGLDPWQAVTVEFRDPRGTPAEWVTEQEFHFASTDGAPVTNRTLYADEEGSMSWLSIGTLDNEGVWSVRLTMDAGTVSVDYPVSQLQLPVRRIEEVGVELRLYQGFVSDMYYSTLVSDSLVVDLQAHLAWVVEQLQERLGIQSSRIPDIYLAGSRGLFEVVSEATGREVGFENGYYSSGGSRPGIYMRTDFFRTRVQRLLTQEYLHLVLGELADGRSPPA